MTDFQGQLSFADRIAKSETVANANFSVAGSEVDQEDRMTLESHNRPMRINEAPIVETHVIRSSEPPGGVGEVPTATVGPAVGNAVFAATGKRIRRLPIKALDAVP